MWSLKRNNTNEHKTERDSELENKLMVARGKGQLGLWQGHVHTAILKMDNQQKPIVQHTELCSMLCASLDGPQRGLGENGYRHMHAESLYCSPETIKTLLIDYEVTQQCPTLCYPMDDTAHQAPLSMEFSRQEYWSGLPFSSPCH